MKVRRPKIKQKLSLHQEMEGDVPINSSSLFETSISYVAEKACMSASRSRGDQWQRLGRVIIDYLEMLLLV